MRSEWALGIAAAAIVIAWLAFNAVPEPEGCERERGIPLRHAECVSRLGW